MINCSYIYEGKKNGFHLDTALDKKGRDYMFLEKTVDNITVKLVETTFKKTFIICVMNNKTGREYRPVPTTDVYNNVEKFFETVERFISEKRYLVRID